MPFVEVDHRGLDSERLDHAGAAAAEQGVEDLVVGEPAAFDLGLYPSGKSKDAPFRRPGAYAVYCNIHPRMTAFVVVAPAQWYAQAGNDGRWAIDRRDCVVDFSELREVTGLGNDERSARDHGDPSYGVLRAVA